MVKVVDYGFEVREFKLQLAITFTFELRESMTHIILPAMS